MRDELGQTGSATRRSGRGSALVALTLAAPLMWPQAAPAQQAVSATATATATTTATTEAPVPAAVAEAIRAAATAYRDAVSKGDTAAIRAAWTADGDIVDGWGTRFEARADEVIAGKAATGPRPELRMGETRLRLIAPEVALEDGEVDVVLPGMKTPIEGWFSAVWVRQGGSWKLAALRESERSVATDESMLDDLDWMVGEWNLVAEGTEPKAAAADMTIRWDAGRTFLIREARIPDLSGGEDPPRMIDVHQRIGWDPTVRRIRSWSFSSDGSRGEATWFRDGDSWVALLTTVLPDGRQRTAVHIYSYDGRERCIWRTLPEGLDTDAGLPPRVTWIRKPSRSAP